jgi:hypothetical protein
MQVLASGDSSFTFFIWIVMIALAIRWWAKKLSGNGAAGKAAKFGASRLLSRWLK